LIDTPARRATSCIVIDMLSHYNVGRFWWLSSAVELRESRQPFCDPSAE
jgi:hypothetical protein